MKVSAAALLIGLAAASGLAAQDQPPNSDRAAATPCRPIVGEADLWANPKTNYIVVGEMHGTTETPALFADLACAAQAGGRPVVVAVEVAETDQAMINAFIGSDGGDAARQAFLHSSIWNFSMKDGRSSRAYLDLFERLRALKKAGRIADVVAIQPTLDIEALKSQTAANAVMADRFRSARTHYPNALALILVGSFHAGKTSLTSGTESVRPAAADLPPDETVSLEVATGGEGWNCVGAECGPHKFGGRKPERRAVTLGKTAPSGYDGVIDLGVPATASPPAAP